MKRHLSRHLLAEIQYLQQENGRVIDSDNIFLACNSTTLLQCNARIDVSFLQLTTSNNNRLFNSEHLIECKLNDFGMCPVYQLAISHIKHSKWEQKEISHQSKLQMKLYNKVKLVNNIIVRVTSEYNQIVLPSSMHNIVYTELHKNGSSNY